MNIYYPGNIVIRLIQPPLARNQAEEGGVTGAQDSLLSGHQSIASERETGSHQENPSNQESGARFRFDRNGKGSGGVTGHALKFMSMPIMQAPEALLALSFRLDLANHRR
jgi:hypothetical protein